MLVSHGYHNFKLSHTRAARRGTRPCCRGWPGGSCQMRSPPPAAGSLPAWVSLSGHSQWVSPWHWPRVTGTESRWDTGCPRRLHGHYWRTWGWFHWVRVPGRDRRTGPGRPTRTPRAALTRISESCRLDGSLMAARSRSCALRLAVLLPQCQGVRRMPTREVSWLETSSHAVVFIVLICCLLIARPGYVRPLLLEPAQLAKARRA